MRIACEARQGATQCSPTAGDGGANGSDTVAGEGDEAAEEEEAACSLLLGTEQVGDSPSARLRKRPRAAMKGGTWVTDKADLTRRYAAECLRAVEAWGAVDITIVPNPKGVPSWVEKIEGKFMLRD